MTEPLRTLPWVEVGPPLVGREIKIWMPADMRVLVYQSAQKPGHWISKILATTKDVTTGEIGDFGSTWETSYEPSSKDIADQVTSWLSHEVREQLGLKPQHATDERKFTRKVRMARKKRRGWA